MAEIKLTNVKKIYENGGEAVRDFTLEIKDKEFIVLVGPSGCGKTTTLRMIAGLEQITEGTIEIDGKVVNDLPPKDRDIAFVFQNYALYPHLSVFDNIAFSLKMRKRPKDEIESKVKEVAEIVGLTEFLNKKPGELSGGQKQRVAIGRAMVRNAKVFLMDEPLSNLDAKLRNQMRSELLLLRQRLDTTFVYVTHDQTEAMTLGDRIVVMKNGCIMQVGSPSELFNHPKNMFVAGFIGSPAMNFLPAKLQKKAGNYYVSYYGNELLLDEDKQKLLTNRNVEDCSLILGIRPEHIEIVKDAKLCNLKLKEMMGSEANIYAQIEDGGSVVIKTSKLEILDKLSLNESFGIKFESKNIHLFNKETEESIL